MVQFSEINDYPKVTQKSTFITSKTFRQYWTNLILYLNKYIVNSTSPLGATIIGAVSGTISGDAAVTDRVSTHISSPRPCASQQLVPHSMARNDRRLSALHTRPI